MMNRINAVLFATVLGSTLAVQSSSAGEQVVPAALPTSVKIVSSLPRTGSANAQTTSMVNGIRMALTEIGGKVAGVEVSYEDWDDASPQRGNWDPSIEAANADKAIADAEVVAYIGTYNSGASKVSMPKLNGAGLSMVSPGNTYPGLTKPGFGEANEPMVYRPSGKINYFRVVPTDDVQGFVAAEFAKSLNATKVFVLHDRELYGQGIAQVFNDSAKKLGIEVVEFDGLDTKAANYKSVATKIKQSKAEVVFYGGTTQTNAAQLAKDLASQKVDVKLIVPDGCFEEAFIKAAGSKALEGRCFITFGGVEPKLLGGRGKEFYENYKTLYGKEPEAYAAYGYEAAKVVLTAMERAAKKGSLSRAAVLAEIAATKDFSGALGTWSFDENGDTTNKVMSVNTVKDDKFETVKVIGN